MRIFFFIASAAALALAACASTQLNYNTSDLATSSSDLISAQVLANLAKFRRFGFAIPSQVSIPSGSVTTTNAVTPTFGGPLGLQATTSIASTVAAALSGTTTHTSVSPNGTFGVSASDQWSQNWSIAPLQDPDQLRRLRAIYRFGAGLIDRSELACEYPLVQKAGGSSSGGTSQTVNVYVNGKKVTEEKTDGTQSKRETWNYVGDDNRPILCSPMNSKPFAGTPDPSLLTEPGCIICTEGKNDLRVNPSLGNSWGIFSNGQQLLPADAVSLGHFSGYDIYLRNEYQKEFSDFILFVLESTLQGSASGGGGGAGGKGTPLKAGSPAIVTTPAAPQILLPQ